MDSLNRTQRKVGCIGSFILSILALISFIVYILSHDQDNRYRLGSGPIPPGTLLFTTGSLSSFYEMDLPSGHVHKVSFGTKKYEWDSRISYLSGPNHGVFALQQEFGKSYVFRKVPGQEACQFVTEIGGSFSTVSPDGTKVAYYAEGTDNISPTKLQILNLKTKETATVATNACPYSHPTWSSDGNRLACSLQISRSDAKGLSNPTVSDHYLQTESMIDSVGSLDLSTGHFEPLAIGSGAIWSPSEDSIYADWWRGGTANYYFHPKSTKRSDLCVGLAGIYGFTQNHLMVYSDGPSKQDNIAPLYGKQVTQDVISNEMEVIRIGSLDGKTAIPLIRVYGEHADWDAGSGFTASWSSEAWK